jgi:hypothetical protein
MDTTFVTSRLPRSSARAAVRWLDRYLTERSPTLRDVAQVVAGSLAGSRTEGPLQWSHGAP